MNLKAIENLILLILILILGREDIGRVLMLFLKWDNWIVRLLIVEVSSLLTSLRNYNSAYKEITRFFPYTQIWKKTKI